MVIILRATSECRAEVFECVHHYYVQICTINNYEYNFSLSLKYRSFANFPSFPHYEDFKCFLSKQSVLIVTNVCCLHIPYCCRRRYYG